MPADASRLRRRIGRRDRRALAVLATLAVMATAAGVVFAERPGPPAPGCIASDEAGVMGGGTWRLCGDAALEHLSGRP